MDDACDAAPPVQVISNTGRRRHPAAPHKCARMSHHSCCSVILVSCNATARKDTPGPQLHAPPKVVRTTHAFSAKPKPPVRKLAIKPQCNACGRSRRAAVSTRLLAAPSNTCEAKSLPRRHLPTFLPGMHACMASIALAPMRYGCHAKGRGMQPASKPSPRPWPAGLLSDCPAEKL